MTISPEEITVDRARQSLGSSGTAIYAMVSKVLAAHYPVIVDVGCGAGNLWSYVNNKCDRYIGIDAINYPNFPVAAEFLPFNLDRGKVPLEDGSADVVVSVETIEHLENPRAFVRELYRLAKPEGLVIVTTPNQLSLLSKLTLVLKNEFNAFQESPGCYPAHITALLEVDLIRIFTEIGLRDIRTSYSNQGRIPFTAKQWSSQFFQGRAFSDNFLCIGTK
jgi:SAM-dependent methyltransferase